MKNSNTIPTICIAGRPNVGKSSLFNRILGERRAVVVEQSGTTRDRVEAITKIGHIDVKLVDTGGYLSEDQDELSPHVQEQIFGAMEEASLVVLVTDSIAGLVPADEEVAVILRKFSKNVLLVANKTDNDKLKDDAMEFYQLGFGAPISVSCQHGIGLRGLKRKITELVEAAPRKSPGEDKRVLKIAIVGRPNVGKSSFINNLLERNRVIVSDIPGTTRDSIDTFFSYEEDEYMLIDTAGMRHKRKIKTVVDTFSMMRSKEAIQKSDVVILLLDSAEGATRDDLGILDFIEESGKACLMLVNKWDLAAEAEDVTVEDYEKHLIYATRRLNKVPIAFISAKMGTNVLKSLSMVKVLDANLDMNVSTPYLNKIFEKNDPTKVSIPRSCRRPNFLYIVQSSNRPVEFKYFVNDPGLVLSAHHNYIENQLRYNLPLKGIPIKMHFVQSRKNSRRER